MSIGCFPQGLSGPAGFFIINLIWPLKTGHHRYVSHDGEDVGLKHGLLARILRDCGEHEG